MNKSQPRSSNQLIVQALNAAETNIKLAKQLLSAGGAAPRPSPKDLPGMVGTFDGENMVTEKGEKYKVNPNYASKSVLVYGDTLKKVEEDGRERFKQIERVKRQKVEGILAKKAGKWTAVTPDGSYRVLPEAVDFYGGKEGDEVMVVLPLEDKKAPFAAVESVKKEPSKPEGEKKPVVRKPPVKKRAPVKKKTEDTEKKEEKKEEEEVKIKREVVEDEEELR